MPGKSVSVLVSLMVMGLAATGCDEEKPTPHGAGDGGAGQDGTMGDGGTVEDGSTGADGGQDIECTPSVDQCPAGSECLCCGSIGPSAICVCSTACDTDDDCTDPGLPHCNQPAPASPGICTTADFNCCWMCQ